MVRNWEKVLKFFIFVEVASRRHDRPKFDVTPTALAVSAALLYIDPAATFYGIVLQRYFQKVTVNPLLEN